MNDEKDSNNLRFGTFRIDSETWHIFGKDGLRIKGVGVIPVRILKHIIDSAPALVRGTDDAVLKILSSYSKSNIEQQQNAFMKYMSKLRTAVGPKDFNALFPNISKSRDLEKSIGGYKFVGEDEIEFEDSESSVTKHTAMRSSEDTQVVEDEQSLQFWTKCTSTHLHKALHDQEWAWAAEPFPLGKPIEDVALVYHRAGPRYDSVLHPLARKALDHWCKESPNAERLSKEPWGLQVRITHAGFNHSKHAYEIHLAPSKFLYYTAIQQNLWKAELTDLRRVAIANALFGIDKDESLLLPSAFSTHMAVVSSDGMALLRQRSARTSLYSLAWEAGVGEFMHGPKKTRLPHFTAQGVPSLYLFLKNAVAEELDYSDAKVKDFRIYGVAAEYRSLAPKLIAVYSADIPIDRLLKGAQQAKDSSPNVQAIELTVDGVAAALSNPTYRTWGPTSKLALLLALIQRSKSNTVVEQLERKMKRVDLVSRG